MGGVYSSQYEAPMLAKIREHAASGLEKAVMESSAKLAEPVTISYKDLYGNVQEISKQIAMLLSKRKEGMPKHVTYLINPSIAYVVIELSVWAAGAACVPLSIHSPAPELEYFVENTESPLCIADAAMEAKFKPVAEKLGRTFTVVRGASPSFSILPPDSGAEAAEVKVEYSASDAALILFTSGTTGKPKGVVHTFTSITAAYTSLTEAWKWSSKDHTLHVLPCHHIHGVQNILNTALYNGATVEFTPFDAEHCLKRTISGDITCFHAVPTIYVKYTQWLDKASPEQKEEIRKGLRNDNLRYMVSGSAALPVPTMKSWADISGHVLLERYGMTEIGMALSNNISGTRYPGCVGWPLPSCQVKLDDDGGILIKGPCVFKEYYNMPEATKKEFTEDGWFRSGDTSSFGGADEDLQALQDAAIEVQKATGRPDQNTSTVFEPSLQSIYRIMGRSSVDIIKSGGYKISALEIESCLLTHEKIKECAVIGKPDETWGEKVTAVCILEGDLTLEELRKWGKERLASYKVPQELEVVTELPRNQMGKLEKKKLLDKYKSA
eukprot:TRINITY_DN9409_c3_g1_i1.p1 TRINITY_DN9409_c3_g1~~TRINITY_DN9409_c3_g1_i1.p1  ORF type:complete len:553 (+),score=107.16 TRINITY_DN9409_c3_g1_i1:58-1716(+)